MKRLKIALYSHDTQGFGHVRRNLLISQIFAQSSLDLDILLMCGVREATGFQFPPGVDCVTLPSYYKTDEGEYQSRHLGLPVNQLVSLRSATICAAIKSFNPDVFIVDNVPRGALRELNPVLKKIHKRGHTRCVLGLRDVLDEPDVIRQEWSFAKNIKAIRNYYHGVWIYGDRNVYDAVREYQFPTDIAEKVRFTGYLDQRLRLQNKRNNSPLVPCKTLAPARPSVLCSVGGGQDGQLLAEAFAAANFPKGISGVLVTGPFLPEQVQKSLQRQAASNPQLNVIEFVPEMTTMISNANRVISMGGYNTVTELISFRKHALVVPRITPRTEQLIRAKRFQDMGVMDLLHPANLSPQNLSKWIASNSEKPKTNYYDQIDLRASERLPQFLQDIVQPSKARRPCSMDRKELHHVN